MVRRSLLLGGFVLAALPGFSQRTLVLKTWHDASHTLVREVYQARAGADTVRHGPFRRFYRSGKVEAVGRFTDGKPDSLYTEFYESGQRRLEVPWVAGVKEGAFRAWAPDGKPLQEGTYHANQQTGPFRTFYPATGKVKTEAEFVNGFPEGVVKAYDSTGVLLSEVTYKSQQPNGPTRSFWPGGQVKSVRNYHNGLPDGPETTYYENGQVASEILLKPNAKEGTQRWYYPSGQRQREGTYRIGLIEAPSATYTVAGEPNKPRKREVLKSANTTGYLDGPLTSYFEDGTVEGSTTYRMGAKVGTEQFFYRNGKPREETKYRTDGRDYDRQAWYESGNLQREEHVEGGLKTGEWRTYYDAPGQPPRELARYDRNRLAGEQLTYHPNGKPASRGTCEANRRTGLWTEYDDQGLVTVETTWKGGARNGLYRELRPDGKPAVTGTYRYNRQSGLWTWFDESGKKTKTTTYRNGVEVDPTAKPTTGKKAPKAPVRPIPQTKP